MADDHLASRRAALKAKMKEIDGRLCRDAKELEKAFSEYAAAAHEYALLAFLSALGNAYSRLVMRTPVDTGRARAGWHIEGQQNEWKPEAKTYPEAKGNAAAAIATQINKLGRDLTRADVVYVMNNVEYILPLEAGHSQQSSGFCGLFLQELRMQLEQAARAA